jgi:hypothetical protein
MQSLQQRLDLALIVHLQALCSGAAQDAATCLPPGSGTASQFALLPGENLSAAGEVELSAFIDGLAQASLHCVLTTKRLPSGTELKIFQREHTTPAVLAGLVKQYIAHYHASMAALTTPELGIGAAVLLCQQLQRLRPFPTGNCRTFGILLLNFLLAQQGQCLTMLDSPNKLDGFSAAEVLLLVRQGQHRVAGWRSTAPLGAG